MTTPKDVREALSVLDDFDAVMQQADFAGAHQRIAAARAHVRRAGLASPHLEYLTGCVLLRQQRWLEALDVLRRASLLDPTRPAAYAARDEALVGLRAEFLGTALEAPALAAMYAALIEGEAADTPVHHHWACWLLRNGRRAEALRLLEALAMVAPFSAEVAQTVREARGEPAVAEGAVAGAAVRESQCAGLTHRRGASA